MSTSSRFVLLFILFLTSLFSVTAFANEQEVFFETQVRPLLAASCFECHNAKKQQGDLRLDRKQFVFADGPAGKVVVPGNLQESRLWKVIQYDEFDTQMPPTGKLSTEKQAILKKWIESGAYWPDDASPVDASPDEGLPLKDDGAIDFEKVVAHHWAYQTVREPVIPEGAEGETPIDRFINQKLSEKGLVLSEPATKRQLIRRLSFDLRGLPPGYEEVQAFEADESESAFSSLVDRYLADAAYGERWGRYWLDLARYADTKGYVFTENRFYPYSYTYRDYVIGAFNNDKPYDTFLMEQIAADQLGYAENDARLAALGFLTIGPRFLNRTPDIIDDRIDVVTRGLMGMTAACARCHDHKFDPIPTADYYSLYGVFDSCYEPELPPLHGEIDMNAPQYAEFSAELAKRQGELDQYKQNAHNELLQRAVDHLEDYVPAAIKSMGRLSADVELTLKHGPLRDKLTLHWKNTLESFSKANHPVMRPAVKLLALENPELADQWKSLIDELGSDPEIPKLLIARLQGIELPTRLSVVEVYVAALTEIREEWKALQKRHPDDESLAFKDPEKERFRQLLFGQGSLSDLAPGDYSPLFERDNRDKISNLKKKIDEWHATSPQAPPRSMVLLDKEQPVQPVIFVRGNVGRRGDRVPRRGPQILDPSPEAIFQESSGRKALAEQIVSKENPLTARVMVNRIWMAHFGSPLVETTSDFGMRTPSPLQRQLLDYLAWSLMHQHNWSIKGLHREILLTKVWQQQSLDRPAARSVDPENQRYWRQNRQRLDFEAMRDAMLSATGRLDRSPGGRAVNIEQQPFPTRRTVYALIDRNNPSGLLRTFDFPTPNSSSPARSETTVPQQALFGMNSEFATEMSKSLADRVRKESDTATDQIERLFELCYSRSATAAEISLLQNYLDNGTLEDLAQGLLLSNEFMFID